MAALQHSLQTGELPNLMFYGFNGGFAMEKPRVQNRHSKDVIAAWDAAEERMARLKVNTSTVSSNPVAEISLGQMDQLFRSGILPAVIR